MPNREWRWTSSCHLFADTLDELHAFARRLGLKCEWFQNHKRLPHYDLTPKRRLKAEALGVIQLDRKMAVKKWREIRENALTLEQVQNQPETIRNLGLSSLARLTHESEAEEDDVTFLKIMEEVEKRGIDEVFREEYIRLWTR